MEKRRRPGWPLHNGKTSECSDDQDLFCFRCLRRLRKAPGTQEPTRCPECGKFCPPVIGLEKLRRTTARIGFIIDFLLNHDAGDIAVLKDYPDRRIDVDYLEYRFRESVIKAPLVDTVGSVDGLYSLVRSMSFLEVHEEVRTIADKRLSLATHWAEEYDPEKILDAEQYLDIQIEVIYQRMVDSATFCLELDYGDEDWDV